MTYKKLKDENGNEQNYILASKGTIIPKDPTNRHYAEYLEWVAAGNTAEAAD